MRRISRQPVRYDDACVGHAAVAADLGPGGRLGQRRLVDHERRPPRRSVISPMWRRVSTTIRAARKMRRLEVVELLDRVLEEAALAHHALGVQRPALAEVGRASRPRAASDAIGLAHDDVPVVARVRLVDRGRGDRRRSELFDEPLLDLLLGRAVGRDRARRSGPASGPRTPAARCTTRRRASAAGTPGDGSTAHVSPAGSVTRPVSTQEGARPARSTPRRSSTHRLLGRRVVARSPRRGPRASRRCRWRRAASARISASRRSYSAWPTRAARGRRTPSASRSCSMPRVALLAVAATCRAPGPRASLEVRDPARRDASPPPAPAVAQPFALARRSSTSCQHEVADVAVAASRRAQCRARRSAGARASGRGSRSLRRRRRGTCSSRAIGGVDQVALRAQPVEEQREQAAGDGTRVRRPGRASRPRHGARITRPRRTALARSRSMASSAVSGSPSGAMSPMRSSRPRNVAASASRRRNASADRSSSRSSYSVRP